MKSLPSQMNPCPGVVEFPHKWILNKRMRFVSSPLPNALTSVHLEHLLPAPSYKSLGKPGYGTVGFNTMGELYHSEKKQDKKTIEQTDNMSVRGHRVPPTIYIWYLCTHAGHGNVVIDKTIYFRAFRGI